MENVLHHGNLQYPINHNSRSSSFPCTNFVIVVIDFLISNLQYCLAKDIDNQWYRVQAIEVKYDGHVTAIFVDYGNINILKINCFRRIPSVLMFPCITATVTCFNTGKLLYAFVQFNINILISFVHTFRSC